MIDLSSFSIRSKLIAVMVTLVVVTGAIYTGILMRSRRDALLAEVDIKLLTAARCARAVVGTDYHDAIVDAASIDPETHDRTVAAFNRLCTQLGLQYLWSVLVVEAPDRIVFTTATSPSKDVRNQDHAKFFDLHADPQAFAAAIRRPNDPTYSTFENQWGMGRMVLVPYRDSHGRLYLFGASVQLRDVDALVTRTMHRSILLGLAIVVLAVLASVLLGRFLARPIVAMTAAAEDIAAGDLDRPIPTGGSREIATLGRSFATMRDALRERLAEIRASEENLAITLDSIGDAVIVTDTTGQVVRMNPIAEDLTGWPADDALGRPMTDVFHIVNAHTRIAADNPIERVLAEGCVVGLANHTVLISRAGKERQIADSAAPIRNATGQVVGVVLVFRDVTHEYALQEQLRHAQKMEAVGQLAGGVAHDFNNLLTAIRSNAEMIAMELGDGHNLRPLLEPIQSAATRGADLTRQLLNFARKGKQQMVPVDLHATIAEVTELLRRSLDPRIEIRHAFAAPHATITGDPSQLQNALVNVAVNAGDAMPDGGTLTFATTVVSRGGPAAPGALGHLPPGDYLQVNITDTGHGMDTETHRHAFEPFFTTKPFGKGTGLGLAAVYGTVQAHDGAVDILSTPGAGTTIRLFLPLARTVQTPPVPAPAPPPAERVAGHGHILVVDDEEMIRETLTYSLGRLGFRVTTCADGQAAVDFYREHGAEVDLILLDERMPRLSGLQAFAQLRAIDPHVRVVAMSGYTDEGVIGGMLAAGALAFLAKPFTFDELNSLLAQHLPTE